MKAARTLRRMKLIARLCAGGKDCDGTLSSAPSRSVAAPDRRRFPARRSRPCASFPPTPGSLRDDRYRHPRCLRRPVGPAPPPATRCRALAGRRRMHYRLADVGPRRIGTLRLVMGEILGATEAGEPQQPIVALGQDGTYLAVGDGSQMRTPPPPANGSRDSARGAATGRSWPRYRRFRQLANGAYPLLQSPATSSPSGNATPRSMQAASASTRGSSA